MTGADCPRETLTKNVAFRKTMDRCEALFHALTGKSLLGILYPNLALGDSFTTIAHGSELDETQHSQPALFALEWSLAELWRSKRVVPSMVLGHGVDEIAPPCVAGVMSMEDAMKLVVMRGRLMQSLSHNEGVRFAVRCSPSEVRDASGTLTEEHASSVSFAAANGPRRVVVSGPEGSV